MKVKDMKTRLTDLYLTTLKYRIRLNTVPDTDPTYFNAVTTVLIDPKSVGQISGSLNLCARIWLE